jgi:hypothetical protein
MAPGISSTVASLEVDAGTATPGTTNRSPAEIGRTAIHRLTPLRSLFGFRL